MRDLSLIGLGLSFGVPLGIAMAAGWMRLKEWRTMRNMTDVERRRENARRALIRDAGGRL